MGFRRHQTPISEHITSATAIHRKVSIPGDTHCVNCDL